MRQHKINFEELNWEEPIEGVKHKIYKSGNKQLRLVVYTKEMPSHWCENGHYGLVLDGEFEIEFQNDKLLYRSGDGVFIPSGEEHKHKARVLSESVKVIFVEDV